MLDRALLFSIGLVILVFSRIALFIRNLRKARYVSGYKYPFAPYEFPGIVLPTTWWSVGNRLTWKRRSDLYRKSDLEMISIIPYISGEITLYTNSAEVTKQILANKSGFEKLPFAVEALSVFGENVFSTYQGPWLRHRRVLAPGFNLTLYSKVWDECMRTYNEMSTHKGWKDMSTVTIPDVNSITSKIALFIIASCGFGQPLSWGDTVGERVNGLTIEECFDIGSNALDALQTILKGIIKKRRAFSQEDATEKEDKKDLFTLLLQANEAEKDAKLVLSDEELVSNVFFMLLAGHETTSKALATTLGLLACHPAEQQSAYEQVTSFIPSGSDPGYGDFDQVSYIQACLFESLRLYPSAHVINRRPLEDKVLSVPTKDGGRRDVLVKKDTGIALDFIGICYNPRHYPSPTKFVPSRWASADTEQLMMFSYGPRVCIGKKFALVEAVSMLTLFLRDWHIEPVLRYGESLEEWRTRVLDQTAKQTIGFGPGPVPLKLTRRKAQ